jgi:YVTN family beta-propeller protein
VRLTRATPWLALWAAFLIAACGGTSEPGGVVALEVFPDSMFLARGDSERVLVGALDADSNPVAGVAISFTSSDTSVATVSTQGMVRSAGSAGEAVVTVSGGGTSTAVPVTVVNYPAAIELVPLDTSLYSGESFQMAVSVRDSSGQPLPLQLIILASSDTSVATISAVGLVESQGPLGSAIILGAYRSVFDASVVHVVDDRIELRRTVGSLPSWAATTGGGVALITLQGDATAVRLDLSTRAFGPRIAVGEGPNSVAVDPGGATAYVGNETAGTVSVVDIATDLETDVIPVPGRPFTLLVGAGGSQLFVTTSRNFLYRVDLASKQATDSLTLPSVVRHMAFNADRSRLYISTGGAGSVLEVDPVGMTVLRTFAIGGRVQGVALSPDGTRLYAADDVGSGPEGPGLVTWDVTATTEIGKAFLSGGAYSVALNGDGSRALVTLRDAGEVADVNTTTGVVLGRIRSGGFPQIVAFDASAGLFVTANGADWVDMIP